MKLMTRLFLPYLIFLFPLYMMAQNSSLPQLTAAVAALDKDADLKSANWSICVMDANTGQVLLDHNIHRNLITASTMKAFTTASALSILGTDFRFNTLIQHDGSLDENGTLNGNIIIKGDGDPTLGSWRFGETYELSHMMIAWSQAIKNAGIKKINGRVIADASVFSSQLTPGEWPWEDMGNYYGAGASGLNIHENQYRLDLKPGNTVGSSTEVIRTDPPMSIAFVNELTTGRVGSGDNAYIFGSPYNNLRYIRGTIPAGVSVFSIKGSIPDPALYCAYLFTEELNKCSITVNESPTSVRVETIQGNSLPSTRKTIYTHSSPTLEEIVDETNMYSINLYAEALAKRIAVHKGKEGSARDGVEAMEDYWRAQGVATKGMYLRDGSGLSPNNALSTSQLTSILCKMRRSPQFTAFDESLPVAGRSGSLKSMLKGTVAEGKLRAKSGYISGVRSYAGYASANDGRLLAFTMIANYYDCSAGEMRRKFERLMVKIVEGK